MPTALPCSRRLILLCCYLCLPLLSWGQDVYERDKAVAAPPNGKGLGSAVVGGIPVNLFTGTASPSLPLYEAPGRSLSIPIALYYTAGNGVQVTSVASEVGTGWALSAGGSVQCEVRGRPDELDSDAKSWVPGVIDRTSGTYAAPFMCAGKDSEYDVYHVSALGLQADFVINGPNDVRVLNNPTLTVAVTYLLGGRRIYSIVVTDANGTRYTFSQGESTRVQTETKVLRLNRTSGKDDYTYTSAWYLTNVQDARGDAVYFSYQYERGAAVSYKSFSHVTAAYLKCNAWEQNCQTATPASNSYVDNRYETTTTIQPVTKPKLSHIYTTACEVRFLRGRHSRRDAPGEKALDRIVVYDKAGNVLNTFTFGYSYFGPATATDPDAVRLRLDRVSAKASGCLTTTTTLQYREYGPTVSRRATNKDYWGYFNDNPSNELLTYVEPRFVYGDRTPSAGSTAQNCILYKVVQGTSAYTELAYAPQIDGAGARVGGVRLTQVRVHDGQQTTQDQVYNLGYNLFDAASGTFSASSSAPVVPIPLFHDWQKVRWSTVYPGGWGGYGEQLEICDSNDDLIDMFLYRSSEPVEPIAPDYIHYKWVTIQQPNGAKTTYQFSTAQDYPDTYNNQSVKVTADPYNTDTGCYTTSGGLPAVRGGSCNGDPMSPRRAGNYLNLPQDQRPYGIKNSAANKRGYVTKQIEFDSQGRVSTEITNYYNFWNYDASPLRSAAVARERYVFGYIMYNNYYNVKVYKLERDWVPLTRQSITRYDQRQGNAGAIAAQTQNISYEYRNNLPWKVTTSKNGDNNLYVTEYTRVRDGNAPVELVNAKSYATVLRKEEYRLDVANNKYSSFLTYYEFEPNSNNLVWPKRTATVDAGSGDNRRQYRVNSVEFDGYGNSVNTQSVNGLWAGTLYGHNFLLPTAAVVNGRFSNGSIAATAGHTSFEDGDNYDQWSAAAEYANEAKTGKRSMRLSPRHPYGSERLFLLTPAQQKGKYKFSCWAKSPAGAGAANLTVVIGLQDANRNWLFSSLNNQAAWYGVGYTVNDQQKWRLYTATVDFDDPAVRAAIPAGQDVRVLCGTWLPWGTEPVLVDELRFHHENARMKTTTYQPMVGKTSETDENNVTTYQLYDAENRPWMVKDADGNVLKRTKTNSVAASREVEASVARTGGNAYPGEAVTFTATAESCDGNLVYHWNFGDGSAVKGSNVQAHTYARPGTYQLTMVAEAPGMNPVEKTLTVVVTTPMQVNGTYDGNTYMDLCNPSGDGSNGQREVSVTVDPQYGCPGYAYRWEFNEFRRASNSWSGWTDANNTSPTYDYQHYSARQIQVRCTVTDACGNTSLYEGGFTTVANDPNCAIFIPNKSAAK